MLFAPLLHLYRRGFDRTAIAFGSHPIGVFPETTSVSKGFVGLSGCYEDC